MAVCSEIHTKHINTLCGQNVEFVKVKLVTTGLNYIYIYIYIYIYRPSPYRAVNTLRLTYKNQSLNAV